MGCLCLQVVNTLLGHFHAKASTLSSILTAPDQDLPSVLLQQLEYIASVRTQLRSNTTAACKQQFKLVSSSGSLLNAANLHLPPREVAAEKLLQDLTQAGKGLQLLSPAFQQFWADEEKCLVLTRVLGVKQADAAAVVGALAKLHSSNSSISNGGSIDEEQLMRHLRYVASHIDILGEGRTGVELLARVKGAMQLPDSNGTYRSPESLFFPLGREFSSLEQDLEAAGMRFLGGSIAAAAGGSMGQREVVSHKRMEELLLLLGVKKPDLSAVVESILQLYKLPLAAAALAAGSHMSHMHFLFERWGEMDSELKEGVKRRLLLKVAASSSSGSCGDITSNNASSTGAGGGATSVVYAKADSVFIPPKVDSQERVLLGVLELGGAKFLAEEYTAAQPAGSTDFISWVQMCLKVQEISKQQVMKHILLAHMHRKELEVLCTPQQILRHALYIAEHYELLSPQKQGDELQLKQRLLIGVAAADPSSNSSVTFVTAVQFQGTALYWPEKGDGWELTQVLPPAEVSYVVPEYAEEVEQLGGSAESRSFASSMKKFFTQQLGVMMLPRADSEDLQRAVAAGDRWQAILLMLKDRWPRYSGEKKQLCKLLSTMQVCVCVCVCFWSLLHADVSLHPYC